MRPEALGGARDVELMGCVTLLQGFEEESKASARMDYVVMAGILALALAMRLYNISHPSGVV